ncbi:MAG: hypothetical protein NT159_16710 [Proteobacteria bacterium]|nr:hypothetical protein [Pseudomonadota bacterium]
MWISWFAPHRVLFSIIIFKRPKLAPLHWLNALGAWLDEIDQVTAVVFELRDADGANVFGSPRNRTPIESNRW